MAIAAKRAVSAPRRRSSGVVAVRVAQYGVLIFFALICLLPLLWVIANSLKTTREIAISPLALPSVPHWQNYVDAWTVGRFGKYFGNSLITSIPIVLGGVALSSLAGYGFARFNLPGSRLIFYLFLLGLMVPIQSIMIPRF